MKKIGICPSPTKHNAKNLIQPIAELFLSRKFEVYLDPSCSEYIAIPRIERDTVIDTYVSLGGDGTLLAYKHKYAHNKTATFTSVNLGRLGFMADVPVNNFISYFSDFMNGEYAIDERIMLQVEMFDRTTFFAINDFVIHRNSIKKMILLKIYVNGDYLNSFHADGIIISTPTGSTAYSLSAGGPILDPQSQTFLITPIAPHTLVSRPLVISSNSQIEIEYLYPSQSIEGTIDGLQSYQIKNKEKITLTCSQEKFKLISFIKKQKFYDILRNKLFY